MSRVDLLFRFPDVLSPTLFTCNTVNHVCRFAGDVLFDVVCARCLCDVDVVGEGAQFARVAPFVATWVEPDLCVLCVLFLVSE